MSTCESLNHLTFTVWVLFYCGPKRKIEKKNSSAAWYLCLCFSEDKQYLGQAFFRKFWKNHELKVHKYKDAGWIIHFSFTLLFLLLKSISPATRMDPLKELRKQTFTAQGRVQKVKRGREVMRQSDRMYTRRKGSANKGWSGARG